MRIDASVSGSPVAFTPAANKNGSYVQGTVSTVTTLTPPANTVGFVLQALDTNTVNFRWSIGATATATNGMQMEPGRDTGFVAVAASVSICAESSSATYLMQWILLS